MNSEIWKNNLKLVEQYAPLVFQEFTASEPLFNSCVKFEETAGKRSVALIKRQTSWLPLHSKVDPQKEAARFIDTLSIQRIHNVIFFGLGLGYHIVELLGKKEKPDWVTIVEADLYNFWAFCHLSDISFLYKTKGVYFLLKPSPEQHFSFLAPHSFSILVNELKLIKHPSARFSEDYYRKLFNKTEDFKKWAGVNIQTQINAANIFSQNIFSNLSNQLKSVPFIKFKNAFKGFPSIIASGGPSLGKNGHLIRKAKNRAVIIAVDTSVRFLMENGIEPDFIVSMDFTKNALNYFDDIPLQKNAILLVDPEVFPPIVANYTGIISFCTLEGKAICEWLKKIIGDYGTLSKGLSVAHMAFSVAQYIGTGPIIFTGQDLAFSYGRTHVKGASHGVHIDPDVTDFITEGLFGPVKTSNNLKIFLSHFEEMISSMQVNVINATEGGAIIKGAKNLTLREVLLDLPLPSGQIRNKIEEISHCDSGCINIRKVKKIFATTSDDLAALVELAKLLQNKIEELLVLIKNGSLDRKQLLLFYDQYIPLTGRLAEFQDLMELIKDNMLEAFIVRAKKFPKDFLELDIAKEREMAVTILQSNKIYYDNLILAASVIQRQIRDV